MREAHAHILQIGRARAMLDLSRCVSAEDMLGRIASRARALGAQDWLLAHGVRPEGWARPEWPSLDAFDRASGGRRALAWCFDSHALMASSAAMRAARIDAGARFEHGRVVTDDAGDATGVLLEHAALAAWDAVPEPDEGQRRRLVRDACAHLRDLGYREVHDLKAPPWLGGVLRDLLDAREIDQSFTLFPLIEDLDAALDSHAPDDDRVVIGGGKIFTDGTLNSRTAWVLERWADAPADRPFGTPMMTHERIGDAIERARARGLPIAAHAIGDGAVRAVLDAVEERGAAHTGVRIEHAELIDAHDVPRFAALGVIASVQPCHLLADIEALRRACPGRLDRVLPLRDLIDSGLMPGSTLLFGSDAPIVRADPADSVLAATRRRRAGMDGRDAIGPDQCLTEHEALACFGV